MLDIPTWNEYIGTWHGSGRKIREELPDYFKQIAPVLGGRPLFITEYGLCEPAFVGGDRRRTDDMLYHIKEWTKQDFVTGYIYFCLETIVPKWAKRGWENTKSVDMVSQIIVINPSHPFMCFAI